MRLVSKMTGIAAMTLVFWNTDATVLNKSAEQKS